MKAIGNISDGDQEGELIKIVQNSLQITQPLYQQVYEIVKRAILEGELKPGSKVVVTQLADKYNISRTPLREALRQLQIEGLLVQNHSVLFVMNLDLQDFKELYECRLMLEREIMKLVTKTITDEQLEEVEELLQIAEEALKEGNHLQLLELNAQFHDKLLETSSNNRAVQLLQQVRSFLLIYRSNILRDSTIKKEILQEHRQILQALKERNEEAVSKRVEEHLLNDKIRGTKIMEE
jgi:DNA-binding GntR family transcriptional regulator